MTDGLALNTERSSLYVEYFANNILCNYSTPGTIGGDKGRMFINGNNFFVGVDGIDCVFSFSFSEDINEFSLCNMTSILLFFGAFFALVI